MKSTTVERRPVTVSTERTSTRTTSASSAGNNNNDHNSLNGEGARERRAKRESLMAREHERVREMRARRSSSPTESMKTTNTRSEVSPIHFQLNAAESPLSSSIVHEVLRPMRSAPISTMSIDAQEAVLLEDLLYVLLGFSGTYISLRAGKEDKLRGPEIHLTSGIDSALRDMTNSILIMARHYVAVCAFVDTYAQREYGTVSHALTATIRELISEYLLLIAQLEHQFLTNPSFTLHSLALHARPTAQSLAVIYDFIQDFVPKEEEVDDDTENMDDILEQLKAGTIGTTTKTKRLKGGAILEKLSSRLRLLSGDPIAKRILEHLLRQASVPYTSMLNLWIHHGIIKDPHEEFMIKEQASIRKEGLKEDYTGVYWDKRYTIRKSDVPAQLEDHKDKILLAGKYLNVVRECDVDIVNPSQKEPTDFDDPDFYDNISRAYGHANTSLLNLLLQQHDFSTRMISIKYYFFLSHSDFFTGFQHHAYAELSKVSKVINQSKLQSLLDININVPGTIAGNDKYNHDVKIDMARQGLFDLLGRINSVTGLNEEAARTGKWTETVVTEEVEKDISGFDALQLDYYVPFPLNLVLNRKAIFRYQLLFRHLYQLRHTQSLLHEAWIETTKAFMWTTKSDKRPVERWKGRAWTLRAKMLGFVTQVHYYCTSEVIDPRFSKFLAGLSATETVDNLMQDHEDFLDTCLKECMLTNQRLLKLYAKIITLCQGYAQWCFKLSKYLEQADPNLARRRRSKSEADDTLIATMLEKLEQYEKTFDRTVKVLLDTLNYIASTETVSLLVLSSRLDWNKGFRDDSEY